MIVQLILLENPAAGLRDFRIYVVYPHCRYLLVKSRTFVDFPVQLVWQIIRMGRIVMSIKKH